MANNNSSQLKTTNLQCKNLYEYLASYSRRKLKIFYNQPTICLALFRDLPELSHQYADKLLHTEEPISQEELAGRALSNEHWHASKILSDLYLLRKAPSSNGLLGWILCPTFKRNLDIALSGDGKPRSLLSSPLDPDKKAPDVALLDAYSALRWKFLLHYLVGLNKDTEAVTLDTAGVLLYAGFMKRKEMDGSFIITCQGLKFVLLERQAQVWQFILQYLDSAEERGLDLTECLTFLFQLSFSTLGKDYSTEGMSEALLVFLQHLREFGLVYQSKRKTGRFYPTRLALNIINKHQSEDSIFEENGSKDLQASVLGLFTEISRKFSNLMLGRITRNSVHQALKCGTTTEQIIGYLKQYSHSEMIQPVSVFSLPPTVMDQIKLWEMEQID